MGERDHGFGEEIAGGAAGDVIQEVRHRHGVGDGLEVGIEAALRRFVVIGDDLQGGGATGVIGGKREVNRLAGGVAARTGNHRQAPGDFFHGETDDGLVFGGV